MAENWRLSGEVGADAQDYFGQQKKRVALEQRRPVPRKAADLVGPGIGGSAVRITDYDDVLATFNGYYSSAPGANNSPDFALPLEQRESFIGQVVSDSLLGGRQTFTGMVTGTEFTRVFLRSDSDPSSVGWGAWRGQRIPATGIGLGQDTRVLVRPNEDTTLKPPTLQTIGESIYSVSEAGVGVLKQGVYSGFILLECNNFVTANYVYLSLPSLGTGNIISHVGVAMAQAAYFPFLFATTVDTQTIAVTVQHTNTTIANIQCGYRLNITRVGDAE